MNVSEDGDDIELLRGRIKTPRSIMNERTGNE